MDYLKLNKSRHKVTNFNGEKIPTVDVKQIISTAVLAPSANNIQPWLFAIVESDKKRAALINETAEANHPQLESAGAVIVLFSDSALAERSKEFAKEFASEFSKEEKDYYESVLPVRFERKSAKETTDYLALNSGIVAMNLALAIKDYGYESNIVLGFTKSDKINEILEVPLRFRPELIIPLGKSDDKGVPHLILSQDKLVKIVK